MSKPTVIPVAAERNYDVVIGHGIVDRLPGMLEGADRVAIMHPPTLQAMADTVASLVRDAGFAVTMLAVPDAEQAKTAQVAAECWTALGEAGFTRNDAIIGLGGGTTTDLAGFVAATWLRGITVVQVPTTLLAMVDAAVGGKTGINTSSGKNLVGAFWSPGGVLCDIDTLMNLPRADLLAGMAEVAKIGFIRDLSILDDIQADPERATDPASPMLADLIRRAVQVKADVVALDFRESATAKIGREALNYGHTLGHAIERLEDFTWRHGAAISVGMVYVAELARIGGRLSAQDVDRHREVLSALELPVTYPGGRWPELMAGMSVDKKSRGSTLRFVVLDGLGNPSIWAGPEPAALAAAYEAITP